MHAISCAKADLVRSCLNWRRKCRCTQFRDFSVREISIVTQTGSPALLQRFIIAAALLSLIKGGCSRDE